MCGEKVSLDSRSCQSIRTADVARMDSMVGSPVFAPGPSAALDSVPPVEIPIHLPSAPTAQRQLPMRFCNCATYPGCRPGFLFWLYAHSSPSMSAERSPKSLPSFAQCEHTGLIPSHRIFFLRQGRHLQHAAHQSSARDSDWRGGLYACADRFLSGSLAAPSSGDFLFMAKFHLLGGKDLKWWERYPLSIEMVLGLPCRIYHLKSDRTRLRGN